MKQEYKNKITKMKKKIDNLYTQKECIVGNIENNKYIQLMPTLIIIHTKKNGDLCEGRLPHNYDLRKGFKECPSCNETFNELSHD